MSEVSDVSEVTTVLKIACMYCGADMGEKDSQGTEGISHSICEPCWYDQSLLNNELRLGLYPDSRKHLETAVEIVRALHRCYIDSLLDLGYRLQSLNGMSRAAGLAYIEGEAHGQD